jgi:hypothetical protein
VCHRLRVRATPRSRLASAGPDLPTPLRARFELVYTGPDANSLHRTLQALLEVVRAARERLWVVSYLIGPGVDPALSAIRERVDAGVAVRVLLDHLHSSYPLSRATLTQHRSAPEVFVWPDDKRQISATSTATLQAKCAVADGRRAFVSSAREVQSGCRVADALVRVIRQMRMVRECSTRYGLVPWQSSVDGAPRSRRRGPLPRRAEVVSTSAPTNGEFSLFVGVDRQVGDPKELGAGGRGRRSRWPT